MKQAVIRRRGIWPFHRWEVYCNMHDYLAHKVSAVLRTRDEAIARAHEICGNGFIRVVR